MTCSDEKDISRQDRRIIKCTHAHSFGVPGEQGTRAEVTEMASGRLLDVARNINGQGGPAANYDGYMYDFLVCNYRPSKLPMHECDVGRDYKDLDECAIFS